MAWLFRFIVARFGMRLVQWGWRKVRNRRIPAPVAGSYGYGPSGPVYDPGTRRRF